MSLKGREESSGLRYAVRGNFIVEQLPYDAPRSVKIRAYIALGTFRQPKSLYDKPR